MNAPTKLRVWFTWRLWGFQWFTRMPKPAWLWAFQIGPLNVARLAPKPVEPR